MNQIRRTVVAGLIVLSCAAVTILMFAATLRMENGAAERHWDMRVSDTLPLQLMDELTGELTRTVHPNPKTGRPDFIEVGYKDGRLGTYHFDNGHLSRYQSFEADKTLRYEAEYDATGALTGYRFLRKDGTQETVYRRNLSGSEELSFFDAKGLCIKSVVTAADGSQTISVRDAATARVSNTNSDASASEKEFYPVETENGTIHQLKMKLQGVRLKSWEYRNKEGTLLHTGTFTADGDIEMTIYSAGKAVLKQTWTGSGEDWTRRYYRLSIIRQLDGSGEVASEAKLQADGKTPLEISTFYGGRKNNTNHYDSNGFHYRTSYYDYSGSPSSSYEIPAQYRRQSKFSPLVLGEPSDGKQPLYRLRGVPYSSAPEENAGPLPAFFLNAK